MRKSFIYLTQATSIIPRVVYKEKYDVDYRLIALEEIFTFGGLPLLETLSCITTKIRKQENKDPFLHVEIPTRQPRSKLVANETTWPMRKAKKGEDDSTESKGGHGFNTIPWRLHTIKQNIGILLSSKVSTSEDLRPLLRKARPTNFQKWVKKYDGNGDPFKHMASFRQFLRAKQVLDWQTQFEGFRMTLGREALIWF